jgi:hypothetical protein
VTAAGRHAAPELTPTVWSSAYRDLRWSLVIQNCRFRGIAMTGHAISGVRGPLELGAEVIEILTI